MNRTGLPSATVVERIRIAFAGLSSTNRPWIAAMLLAPPVIGSAAAALYWLAAGFGVLALAAHARALAIPRGVLASGIVFAAYFLAEASAGILNWRGASTFGAVAANLAFLGLLPLWQVIRAGRGRLLAYVRKSAPVFTLAAAAFALLQQYGLGYRPQGGAGNPGVFAATSAVVFVFALDAFASEWRGQSGFRSRAMALAGASAAALAVLLSGSRALWPVLVLAPALFFATGMRVSRNALIAGALALLLAMAFAAATIAERVDLARGDIERAQGGDLKSPIGKRLAIWRVAIGAIAERPLLGHGPDSPHRLMDERTVRETGIYVRYSHFHNFLLNEAVRAGLVGMLALLAMFAVPLVHAFKARERDEVAADGFRLLAGCQIALVASGAFNILFGHDILDALFVAVTAVCLYFGHGRDAGAETGK
jgi:O-antigen ligase